ncbi:MAG: hypothetical protein K2K57_13745 [Oscillospiraceae bacterium]|nr:hypothetical protein [Oscillospiraceae bacterium]
MAVYNNNIFYVTYGSWSETDEPYYNLHTIDFSGNDTKIKANYHETYSPIYFLNTENILYIVWRDEEIKEVKTDDNYFWAGVYTDKCYVYDAAVQQIITVKVPQETYDERYIF